MTNIIQTRILSEHTILLKEIEKLTLQSQNKQIKKEIIISFLEENEQLFTKRGYNYSLQGKLITLGGLWDDRDIQARIDSICENIEFLKSPLESLCPELLVHIAGFLTMDEISNLRAVSKEVNEKIADVKIMTAHFTSVLPNFKKKEDIVRYIEKYGNKLNDVGIDVEKYKLSKEDVDTIFNCAPHIGLSFQNRFDSKKEFFQFLTYYGFYLKTLDLIYNWKNVEEIISFEEFKFIIESCPNINVIYPHKKVSDDMLACLASLQYLRSIYFIGCTYFGSRGIESLTALSDNIFTLDLGDCTQLSNDDMKMYLQKFTQLQVLVLPKQINDATLLALKDLKKIYYLNMRDCSAITDKGLESLKDLKNFLILSLENCTNIRGEGLSNIKSSQFRSLSLRECNSLTDEGLGKLAYLPNLTSLILSNCPLLTGQAIKGFSKFPKLKRLTLERYAKLTGEGLGNLPLTLIELDLTGCLLTDEQTQKLERLSNLSHLSLKGCSLITDKATESIMKLSKLSHLNLKACNNLTDKGMENLKNLPLRHLRISSPGISSGCLKYFMEKGLICFSDPG